MTINAKKLGYKELNEIIKKDNNDIEIDDCYGHRYIASGFESKKNIVINGVPGNALGSYLNGPTITVNGNVQDAVGDTMNKGSIIINGNAGDALGYSMRGGFIYVKGDTGYRTGIHMKEFEHKKPVIVIGGKTGSFLGEYLAGGVIVVLGLNSDDSPISDFTGTGMHGGKIFVRSKKALENLPVQVSVNVATTEDLEEIKDYISTYCAKFSVDEKDIYNETFYLLTPNAKSPYKRLYTKN